MPTVPHTERHFTASETVRDVVIGMADGLTVPFALAAGLSGAVDDTGLVVTAGLAEIVAGSIAMGLGGYLAARTDAEHYHSEYARETRETHELPEQERREVAAIFRSYGLRGPQLDAVVTAIASDRQRWVDFMMKFELGLEEPNPRRAPASAATIGGSYVVGGLIPLLPYMLMDHLAPALRVSVAVTLVALAVFGAVKGRLTGVGTLRSGVQTLAVGGLAAAAAYTLATLIG
ncbi:VIT1/CCC1 transporter family protein [Azospirillum sp. sgz302134]